MSGLFDPPIGTNVNKSKIALLAYNAYYLDSKTEWELDVANADTVDNQHASEFSTTGHNHDTTYLGINDTASNSDLLESHNSSYFATVDHNHDTTYLGITSTANNSDQLDGYDSDSFVMMPTVLISDSLIVAHSTQRDNLSNGYMTNGTTDWNATYYGSLTSTSTSIDPTPAVIGNALKVTGTVVGDNQSFNNIFIITHENIDLTNKTTLSFYFKLGSISGSSSFGGTFEILSSDDTQLYSNSLSLSSNYSQKVLTVANLGEVTLTGLKLKINIDLYYLATGQEVSVYISDVNVSPSTIESEWQTMNNFATYLGESATEPATYAPGNTWYDTSSTGELKFYVTSVGWITIG